jgi:aspartate ammonia-lyase
MKTDLEPTRTEHDLLGTMEIPAGDLRGIHTFRAMANFSLAGRPVHWRLVRAYALVKKACAEANRELGLLNGKRADAISVACDEIARGEHSGFFTTDALQGGAGTSTNMNLNEVIANRANALLGLSPGTYAGDGVHPLDNVNLHQSTNDTYPTALKVCLIGLLHETAASAADLQGALQRKEKEFAPIVTVGRTELQDAVPMTLGAIFSSFAECAGRDRWRTFKSEERLRVVNLGGTAVGTGLTAPRSYIFRVTDILRNLTGLPLARAENLVDATANIDSLVEVTGILAAFASDLGKIARDIRFLAQKGEIVLPALQAGSSIMPGKVNPVACEAVIQAAMRARANASLVAEAASEGTLQINEYLPLVADAMIETLELTSGAARMLALHVDGITANADECNRHLADNPTIITAFLPLIGYERTQEILAEYRARDASQERQTIRDFLSEKIGTETVNRILSAESLSALGHREAP